MGNYNTVIMNLIKSIITAIIVSEMSPKIMGTGVFELRLKSFKNEYGKDHSGKCCSGPSALNSKCFHECRTRFRVCLKHYQAQIDTKSSCTFGNKLTPILGNNNVENMEHLQVSGFLNPIRFPFDFTWPGTFSLIVEAFHVENESTNENSLLISRLTTQRWLDISENWTEDIHKTPYSVMHYEFRVTCDAYYYGPGCANFCRPRNDQFGHYICSPSGERICLPGWKGDYCSKPECAPGCDEQHGHCNKPNECLCHNGWKGTLCNSCERYPGCMHGNCSKPWECLCDEGWGGLFCNQDLNYCTNHKPCNNGGTCFNTGQGSYTCSCAPGYTGTECEIELDVCVHNSCKNGGLCSNFNRTGYRCNCLKGYIGSHCQTPTATCDDHPCKNGATCKDSDNRGYVCECPAGYNGTDCEYQINDCLSNPCLNNGNCVDQVNGFQCICPLGFDGFICEINVNDCKNNPCYNGGQCTDGIHQFHCKCKDGYVGPLCENKVNLCVARPCANNGKCIQLANDYNCTCKAGFTGKDCSIEIDECSSQPCQNYGICLDRTNDYVCQCLDGYYGKNCEKFGSISSDVEAQVSAMNSSKFHTEHYAVIVMLSFLIPILILVTIIVMKRKHKKAQAKAQAADEEARLQNEQNAVQNRRSFSRTIVMDPLMIKNSWNKCTNVVSSSTSSNACASHFSNDRGPKSYEKDNYFNLNPEMPFIGTVNGHPNKCRSSLNNNNFSTNYYNVDTLTLKKPTQSELYISTPALTNTMKVNSNFMSDEMQVIDNNDFFK